MRPSHYTQGQAVITTVIFFLVISLIVVVGISAPISHQIRSGADFVQSKQGYISAESINDDALYRLNQGRTLPATMVLPFTAATATASVADVGGLKEITSLGTAGRLLRSVKTIFSSGEGASFSYGIQIGTGGLYLHGSSKVQGNVYANGDIYGESSTEITGSATAANVSNPVADQSHGTGTPSIDQSFGVSGTEDIAQSFQVSTSTVMTAVKFYIKKTGTPSNITVRVTTDRPSPGQPSGTTLGSATLSSSWVTGSYGYVTVPLTTSSNLSIGTTYWIVLDMASTNASNYYTIAASDSTYASGVARKGQWSSSGGGGGGGTWSTLSPAGTDIFFETFMGGDTGRIYGENQNNRLKIGSGGGGGTAWANTVEYATVYGSLYCQSTQHTYNNSGTLQNCDTSRGDPSQAAFPVSDANIQEWKDIAESGGTYTGNYTLSGSSVDYLGPKKITGNLSVGSSAKLYLTGPLWVQGTVTVNGSGIVQLESSNGASDGYIIADGTVSVGGSGKFDGSGTSGSYIMVLTTNMSTCSGTSCTGQNAMEISGSAGSVILVAPYGSINVSGSAKAKQITGKKVNISGSGELQYESGLADVNFTTGPSGSWNVTSWKEIAN